MGLFGRDYDRDYDFGYRGSGWSGDRSFWGTSGRPIRPNYERDFQQGRNRDTGWGPVRGGAGYGSDYRMFGYDRPYGGYDRNYKSRWETDFGDPFGDREQQTPMRVIRGDSGRRSRGLFGSDRYDRDQAERGYPLGYRPYASREGYDAGYNQRTYRTYRNRYDNDSF